MFLNITVFMIAFPVGVALGFLVTHFKRVEAPPMTMHYCYPNSQDDVCQELDRQNAESKRAHSAAVEESSSPP